jgi:hypothetical protein
MSTSFKTKLARLIEKAKLGNGLRKHGLVRIFGEMVDLIWGPHPTATERLEEVPLLCALAGGQSGSPARAPSIVPFARTFVTRG